MSGKRDQPNDQPDAMARAARAIRELSAEVAELRATRRSPVAVVGMSCRFPGGANDPESFWRLLAEGREGISEVPPDRWDAEAFFDPDPEAPGRMYTKKAGFLDVPVDRFDAAFFNLSGREATAMDPQHRLILELVWECLEDAGIPPGRLEGTRTGVYLGISTSDYSSLGALSGLQAAMASMDAYSGTGNSFSGAAGRVSHMLGLNGPNLPVDTACSSSLVALDLAMQALRGGQTEAALVAGVNLILSPAATVGMCRLRALSPEGRCRTFDSGADGYVRGEGAGMVMLKRLSDAMASGDRIHAVVLGSAVNHDGRSGGLTVPNPQAQRALLAQALEDAGCPREQVGYLEAHGTGTSLGDPIELRAINDVFESGRSRHDPLLVGSVKTNFGHLEAAAGVAGVIKVILSLSKREIPRHLHLVRPTPLVDWETMPIRVPTEHAPWEASTGFRVAGVSSFGITGTNAHVLLQEAPEVPAPTPSRPRRPVQILPFSARSRQALREQAARLAEHLTREGEELGDVCFTAAVGRAHLEERAFVLGRGREEVRKALLTSAGKESEADGGVSGREVSAPRFVFLFPGQGAQYAGMARGLFEGEPVFRGVLEECEAVSKECMDRTLLSILDPEGAGDRDLMERTEFAQPAIFAVECGLAALWRSWGIEPSAVLGHSLGEFAAAWAAGAMDLESGFRLVAERGRLMQGLPEAGTMALVIGDEELVLEALDGRAGELAVAGRNAPGQTLLSGRREPLEPVLALLSDQGLRVHRFERAMGFHSPLMDPILDRLEAAASRVAWRPLQTRLVSSVLGGAARAPQLGDPSFWSRQAREPIRFREAVQATRELGGNVFLEVGPGGALLAATRRCLPDLGRGSLLPSLREGREDQESMMESLGRAYLRGAEVDWESFHAGGGNRKVSLPSYPFQRKRYWAFPRPVATPPAGKEAPRQRSPAADPSLEGAWRYSVEWTSAPRPEPDREGLEAGTPGTWIILSDEGEVGTELANALEGAGCDCRLLHLGSASGPSERRRALRVCVESIREILATGEREGTPVRGIVHLWNLDLLDPPTLQPELEEMAEWGCWSLIETTRTVLGIQEPLPWSSPSDRPRVWLVTRGAQDVPGVEGSRPRLAQRPAWGVGRTTALEVGGAWGGMIDLDPNPSPSEAMRLARELVASDGHGELAFRGEGRFASRLVSVVAPATSSDGVEVRPEATYMITGGLGALGIRVAQWLSAQGARHLVLLSRRGFPPSEDPPAAWSSPEGPVMETVRRLEAEGVRVWTPAVDVGDEKGLSRLLAELRAEGAPPIRGIVHTAGSLTMGSIQELEPGSLRAAFQAKVRGSLVLHRLFGDGSLDFFVLFSSMASITGAPGLAAYAAANSFLDGLAEWRRKDGRPGLSVAWGPWAEGGMAQRADRAERDRWSRLGVEELDPELALKHLGGVIGSPLPVVGIVGAPPEVMGIGADAQEKDRIGDEVDPSSTPAARTQDQSIRSALAATPAGARKEVLLDYLRLQVAQILCEEPEEIALHRGPTQLGLDSIMVMELASVLDRDLDLTLFPREIFERPSLEVLAEYLLEAMEPDKEASVSHEDARDAGARPATAPPITVVDPTSRLAEPYGGPRVQGVVLLLSSPRAGSTLLRVMLAGHPDLFCPPELHLLPFRGMAQRQARLTGSHLDEGLPRALMELRQIGAEEAVGLAESWAEEDLPVPEVYLRLRAELHHRLLVDKSPTYGSDPGFLARAEMIFDQARYIHLVRSPHAVIESFVRNRMDRLLETETKDPFALAEKVWASTNANIADHLSNLDPARHIQIRYEDLVRRPREVMKRLADFLGVPFIPELLHPYEGDRMTDGLHGQSLGIGDPNLLKRDRIDPTLANAWRGNGSIRTLGGFARRVARELAYPPEPERSGGMADPASYPISPQRREADTPLPLSFAQERLFFLDRMDLGAATYNVPITLRLEGPLDRSALGESFETVVRRHEVLRTRFTSRAGTPLQRIEPSVTFELVLEDLSPMEGEDQRAALRKRMIEAHYAPFDLEEDLPIRASLVRTGEESHYLVGAMHHIASDGTSVGTLLRELASAYRQIRAESDARLPDLPIQYADYAAWQRTDQWESAIKRQLIYWRDRLEGLPTLYLPTDRPRPGVRTDRGDRATLSLPASLADELRKACAERGMTPFMALLATFKLLLARYSGQTDVVVGTPIAGRNRAETRDLIGFFVNTLVLRSHLEEDLDFAGLLERVREDTLEAYEHQDVPFERLVAELQPPRDLSRTPLFQVMFNMLPRPSGSALNFEDLSARWVREEAPRAKFDLSVLVAEVPDGFQLDWIFNADLFDRETIGRMARHFRILLEAGLRDPETPVFHLPLMDRQERSRILVQWNRTEAEFGPPGTVHGLFEDVADRTPHRPAVHAPDGSLSYGELELRANRLAGYLQSVGVSRGVRVGILTERSTDLVVALLAVLKAGGTYVPLDPAFPEARLRLILEDSGAPFLLTQDRFAHPWSNGDIRTILLDSHRSAWDRGEARRTESEAGPSDLAYTIYTSGSTGTPKGVDVPHRGVTNILRSMAREPGFCEDDVLLSVTTFAFDIAAVEILLPLSVGGATVLVDHETASDGRALARALRESEATVMQATPSGWQLLLDSGWRGKEDLRMISGGEPLSTRLADALLERGSELWNAYGPTETTIWSTVERIESADAPILIGRPIANTQVYVLDPRHRPVPIGVVGELYIGGHGVARGYRNRPELTAELFVELDVDGTGPRRLYRTGDLVRWRADGRLECLGRTDHQLKIRGFRIEPGEIEGELAAHQAVASAAVLPMRSPGRREGGGAPDQLLAFLVPAGGGPSLRVEEVREFLKESLPDYMVPSRFVVVDDFPRTPNGKLDRQALARMDPGPSGDSASRSRPETPTEQRVAKIWKELLGVDHVDLEDNFYDLGGHSMLAMQIVGRIEEEMGVRINPRALNLHTLRQFSAACDSGEVASAGGSARSLVGRALDRLRIGGSRNRRRS